MFNFTRVFKVSQSYPSRELHVNNRMAKFNLKNEEAR